MVLADILLAITPFRLPARLTTYTPGESPFSTNTSVFWAIVVYLATIFGIQEYQKNRPALKLTTLFQAHNIILTAGSGLLLLLVIESSLPIFWKHGLFYSLCDEGAWTSRLQFYYMINYYYKYLELFDTVFLVLKKKPLQFLHVYHHSATCLLCYVQLNGKTSMSWTVIILNLSVHVIMYYYYYATAGGAKFWWKKYLTSLQITQFVIDLCLVYFGTWQRMTFKYMPSLPHVGNCAGSESGAVIGCFLLTSYLFLFINFYFQTYKKPDTLRKSTTNGISNGHVNGKANGVSNGKLRE
jgi:hypothetical protein